MWDGGGGRVEWVFDVGNRDHLADFPLLGLEFKDCILTVGGGGGSRKWGGGRGEWRFGAVVVERDELQ